MAEIIKEALDHPLKNAEWQKIIAQYAFPDSRLQIEKKISNNNSANSFKGWKNSYPAYADDADCHT